jgi:hypothetical protein
VDFDLPFLKSTFLPNGGFSERPGAVKGANLGAYRIPSETGSSHPICSQELSLGNVACRGSSIIHTMPL